MVVSTSRILGVTGVVAAGKSTFSQMLARRFHAEHFCADACVAKLLEENPAVQEAVCRDVHPRAYQAGTPNRRLLREIVFADADKRKALENILHPEVRKIWTARADACRQQGRHFIADIPLLLETRAVFDAVICVGCSAAVQWNRLLARPEMNEDIAKKMIASQWSLADKMTASNHVIWNDGHLDALTRQSEFLARLFDV